LTHLGLSKDGHPKHPLYIGYAVQPVPWPGPIDRVGAARQRRALERRGCHADRGFTQHLVETNGINVFRSIAPGQGRR
jgi:hypothetical protein